MDIQDLPIRLIEPTDFHSRFTLDEERLQDLCGSISKLGLLVPLTVRPNGEKYQLVAGNRRLAALLKLGRETAPCQILTTDEDTARRSAIADNLVREDPTPIETAVAIQRALEKGDAQIEEIAAAMHRSPDWVRRQRAMLDWPEDVLQAIHTGKLSVTAAANLALVTDDQYRAYLLDNAVNNGATARTTAAWLQGFEASRPAPEAVTLPPVPPGQPAHPLVPQLPCICCGVPHRTDQLSHVPLCPNCIPAVRQLGMKP